MHAPTFCCPISCDCISNKQHKTMKRRRFTESDCCTKPNLTSITRDNTATFCTD